MDGLQRAPEPGTRNHCSQHDKRHPGWSAGRLAPPNACPRTQGTRNQAPHESAARPAPFTCTIANRPRSMPFPPRRLLRGVRSYIGVAGEPEGPRVRLHTSW